MRRMVFLFLILFPFLQLFAESPVELKLKEGESGEVPRFTLKVKAMKIQDLTSKGCMGGPVGCQDSVLLKVSHSGESKEIRLYLPRTPDEAKQGVQRSEIFGCKIELAALKDQKASIRFEPLKPAQK